MTANRYAPKSLWRAALCVCVALAAWAAHAADYPASKEGSWVDDMVDAQYRLVKEHLGVKHLRAVMGNSTGGMQTWLWGVKYPREMDALIPMASQPAEMSSRNWMMRRLIVDSIRNDPEWNNGNYTRPPSWRSTPPTTNAARPRPASWIAH